ncbi:MAG: sugar-transfer associated ATP-grasp domain-containing protein [bacterium]
MGILSLYHNRKRVLGMNQRNLSIIRKYNKARSKQIADDKILTKKILAKFNIPTTKMITVINDYKELINFDWDSLPKSFVIKPVKGLEGGGIEIFYNRNEKGEWIKSDKSKMTKNDLFNLSNDILNGKFSLMHEPDRILIEERIKNHKSFKFYTHKGVPDIRVIVFNNVPLMSYIRIPTKESQGKANLALGAIGAGIDIASGVTTSGILGKAGNIEFIPGTKIRIQGLKIPYWNRVLEYAIKVQQATQLNYAAVDFLIDRELGPLVVELNARPGLSIQLANQDGLRWRIRKTEDLLVKSIDKGIRLGKDLFGGEIEESLENISGKDIIGIYENVTLFGKDNAEIPCKAKIDTGADSTSIDISLAEDLGLKEIVLLFHEFSKEITSKKEGLAIAAKYTEKYLGKIPELHDIQLVQSSHGFSVRPYVRINLKIQDTTFETFASIFDRSKLTYPVIVGRKSLARFLIDPTK